MVAALKQTREKRSLVLSATAPASDCWPLVVSKFINQEGVANALTIGDETCTMAIHIRDGSTLLMRATHVFPGSTINALQVTVGISDHASSGLGVISLEVVATADAFGMAAAFDGVSEMLRSALDSNPPGETPPAVA